MLHRNAAPRPRHGIDQHAIVVLASTSKAEGNAEGAVRGRRGRAEEIRRAGIGLDLLTNLRHETYAGLLVDRYFAAAAIAMGRAIVPVPAI
jgi:hypothetical protein